MIRIQSLIIVLTVLIMSSCVTKGKLTKVEDQLKMSKDELTRCSKVVDDFNAKLKVCENQKIGYESELSNTKTKLQLREEQIRDLKTQLADLRQQRDVQVQQVGDLTILSQSANENIMQTLDQLGKKDKYIHLLQSAKSKADSINLALAVNLKGVLHDGIEDQDIEVKVDKTVVFINLSDKMLFNSGSSNVNSQAMVTLGKIAKIIEQRPGIEVMVEGYTDNVPVVKSGIQDNWDLSVKRATSVVRVLQKNFNVDPNKLIAAGRGEYNALTNNATAEDRAKNRRTRIIILPKLDQFYDLLNPDTIPD